MTGPDSAEWATAASGGADERSSDWQSDAPCDEAVRLAAQGASDDELLAAVSACTFTNLVRDATREIGEWLRFDADRLFAAHGSSRPAGPDGVAASDDGAQGNGAVTVLIHFDGGGLDLSGPEDVADPVAARRVTARAGALAAPWRFSCLPGLSVDFAERGPVVVDTTPCPPGRSRAGASGWAPSTVAALDAPDGDFVEAVQRDVHLALIRSETRRICRAFHVDGHRPWWLPSDARSGVAWHAAVERHRGLPVALAVGYAPPG